MPIEGATASKARAKEARILVVDDEEDVRELIVALLEGEGYSCARAARAQKARRMLDAEDFDLVLCDIVMPGESGVALARSISARHPSTAVVMVTARADPELAEITLANGAHGYVIKPFRRADLLIAVSAALRRRDADLRACRDRGVLRVALREQARELRTAIERIERLGETLRLNELETARRLARAIGMRSRETGEHTERVGLTTEAIARHLGLGRERCRALGTAAQLHDIGKVAIPDSILLNPGALTAAERREVQRHTEIGHAVLSGSGGELLDLAAEIALDHHERFDGGGYPRRLDGKQIPLSARIAAVADVFDVLTHDRVYHPARPVEEATEIMLMERGGHFDPELLDALEASLEEVVGISKQLPDPAGAVSGL